MSVKLPFSIDYQAYIRIIENLSYLTFADMLGDNFSFPYVVSSGIVSIEVGFSLLVKAVSLSGVSPEVVYALIASASLALRVYTMEVLRVPRFWILVLNVYAITLFEANALRLGIAASTLLFGLLQLRLQHRATAFVAIAISTSFHLQVILFVFPFFVFYVFLNRIISSSMRLIFALVGASVGALIFAQLIPFLGNEKIVEYVSRGVSKSAGVSVTSVLAVFTLTSVVISIRKESFFYPEIRFLAAILSASVSAITLLVFLTNVAVIGDRAWQLAFLILSTFLFAGGRVRSKKKPPFYFLATLAFVMLINITFRYPVSNFFSPPFLSVSFTDGP